MGAIKTRQEFLSESSIFPTGWNCTHKVCVCMHTCTSHLVPECLFFLISPCPKHHPLFL